MGTHFAPESVPRQRQTAKTSLRVLVGLTYVAMIAVNALANILPINGRNTGGISDSYENLFAPAGLTFSIWGVIYLLLGTHVLYQLGLFRGAELDDGPRLGGGARVGADEVSPQADLLQRVGVLFSVSSLVNVAWIFSWHYDLILVSTLLLATMLVLLILITRTIMGAELSTLDRLFVRLPFSVNFGWITVATIANVTVWLVSIGWDGFGSSEITWAVIIMSVGVIIGTAVILKDRDVASGLVLAWAYFGIWIKHTSESGFNGEYPVVIATALLGVAAFIVAGAVALCRAGPTTEPAPGPAWSNPTFQQTLDKNLTLAAQHYTIIIQTFSEGEHDVPQVRRRRCRAQPHASVGCVHRSPASTPAAPMSASSSPPRARRPCRNRTLLRPPPPLVTSRP